MRSVLALFFVGVNPARPLDVLVILSALKLFMSCIIRNKIMQGGTKACSSSLILSMLQLHAQLLFLVTPRADESASESQVSELQRVR